MVVQFCELQEDIQPFLPDTPRTVTIPFLSVECINSNGKNRDVVFIHKQDPIILAWAFTVHKSQVKTLYCAVVNLVKSKKCSGVTLVALSCVIKIIHLLLKPFYFEQITQVNKLKYLALI